MTHPLLASLSTLDEVCDIEEADLPGFLEAGEGRLTTLFFTGDPDKKLETADVAIVLRELMKLHPGRLRVGLIARSAEPALMKTCAVGALPSLVFYAGTRRLDIIPKIQDWSVYAEKLPRLLAEAAGETVA